MLLLSNPALQKVDFRAVTLEYDGYLTDYHTEWLKRFDEESDKNSTSRSETQLFLLHDEPLS